LLLFPLRSINQVLRRASAGPEQVSCFRIPVSTWQESGILFNGFYMTGLIAPYCADFTMPLPLRGVLTRLFESLAPSSEMGLAA
jgi:hypothetical protein